jgi:hypothetical protein
VGLISSPIVRVVPWNWRVYVGIVLVKAIVIAKFCQSAKLKALLIKWNLMLPIMFFI